MKNLFEFKLDRNHVIALSIFFLDFSDCGFLLFVALLKKEQKDRGKNCICVFITAFGFQKYLDGTKMVSEV